MGHKSNEDVQQETLQRVVRIETRLLQLGDHVGANLRTKQRIDVEPTSCGVVVYVDSMDVSFSRIMAEIKESPYLQGHEFGPLLKVGIRMGDRRNFNELGTINVPL